MLTSGVAPAGAQIVQPAVVTERVSVTSDGIEGDDLTDRNAISADGRFVVMDSLATNLVPGDTNSAPDVFVHDRATRETTRVSVASDGAQADRASRRPAISADGRFVAFSSEATNLAAAPGGAADVYVNDRQTGATTRVSVTSAGLPAAAGSLSTDPALSADGRFVAFTSNASLVPDDVNPRDDVYVHDQVTGTTELVSVGVDGTPAVGFGSGEPSISGDGRFVAFSSNALNLVPGALTRVTNDNNVFVRDRATGTTVQANVPNEPRVPLPDDTLSVRFDAGQPVITPDGRYVVFGSDPSLVPEDTNSFRDIYIRDVQAGVTRLVSITPTGVQADRGVSGGRPFGRPAVSADGRTVAFTSLSTNLVAGDTNDGFDVFVAELTASGTPAVASLRRASVASDGAQAAPSPDREGRVRTPSSGFASMSADGSTVAFGSGAANLVGNDTNFTFDVFVWGPALAGAPPPQPPAPPFRTPVVPPPRPAALRPAGATVDLAPGVPTEVGYRLDLPRRPSPLDVAFLVKTGPGVSTSNGLQALAQEVQAIVDSVAATGIDARYGLASFWDWRTMQAGARYTRDHDMGPAEDAFAQAVAALPRQTYQGAGGIGNASLAPHYTAVHQAATGSGIAAPRTGAPVPPGQGMTLRPGRRAFVLMANDNQLNQDPDGPSVVETVAALQAAKVSLVGLNLQDSNQFTDNRDTQGPMMADLARQTGAVAPAGGVDCNNDGRADVAPGAALVCNLMVDAGPRFSDRYAPAIANLLGALRDELPVRMVVADDAGLDVTVDPQVVEAVDVTADYVGDEALPFTVTFTCTDAQVGAAYPVRLAALVGEAEVATTTVRAVCGKLSEPPVSNEEDPPLAPPADPKPAPQPAPAPAPQPAPAPAPAPQPAPAPSPAPQPAPEPAPAPQPGPAPPPQTQAPPAPAPSPPQTGTTSAGIAPLPPSPPPSPIPITSPAAAPASAPAAASAPAPAPAPASAAAVTPVGVAAPAPAAPAPSGAAAMVERDLERAQVVKAETGEYHAFSAAGPPAGPPGWWTTVAGALMATAAGAMRRRRTNSPTRPAPTCRVRA